MQIPQEERSLSSGNLVAGQVRGRGEGQSSRPGGQAGVLQQCAAPWRRGVLSPLRGLCEGGLSIAKFFPRFVSSLRRYGARS
jgi:hypothetical protein